jgi:hypothetical protein
MFMIIVIVFIITVIFMHLNVICFAVLTVRVYCRSRWSSGYRACHWTQGSRVQTRPRTIDYKDDKNP